MMHRLQSLTISHSNREISPPLPPPNNTTLSPSSSSVSSTSTLPTTNAGNDQTSIANELMLMRHMMEKSERRHAEEKIQMQSQIDNLSTMIKEAHPRPSSGSTSPPQSFLSRTSSAIPMFRTLSRDGNSPTPDHANSSVGSLPGGPAHLSGHHRVRSSTLTLEDDIPHHLLVAKEEIQLLGLIGRGSFGEVWRALYNGNVVAVKVFLSEESDVSSEVMMMSKASGHANIIPLVGVVIQRDPYNDPQVAIVTKYMSNGSLHDMLVNSASANYHGKTIPILELIAMAGKAASGVSELHGRGIIHRDLACRNLLVDDQMSVCVCDFGFARLRPVGKGFTATNLGPIRWEAPESLKNKEYSEKTDVFSFGVCLYEMFVGKEPFLGSTNPAVAYKVLSGERMRIPTYVDPVVATIMTECWAPNPEGRPSIDTVYTMLTQQHYVLQNDEKRRETDNQIIMNLLKGTLLVKVPFHKMGLNTKGKNRFFKVEDDLRRLSWVQGGDMGRLSKAIGMKNTTLKFVLFEDIENINVGATTPNFQRFYGEEKSNPNPTQPKAAFSIMTRDRSIDIICPSLEVMNEWVRGLNMLLGRFTMSSSATPSLRGCTVSIGGDGSRLEICDAVKKYQRNPGKFNDQEVLHLKRVVLGRMMMGDHFLKYRHLGKPHERFFSLHRDCRSIYWSGGEKQNKSKSLSLVDVVEVRKDLTPVGLGEDTGEREGNRGLVKQVRVKGVIIKSNLVAGAAKRVAETRDFTPKDTDLCFSLINVEGERVLSLVCPNENAFNFWCFGITCALQELDETGERDAEGGKEKEKEKEKEKKESTYAKMKRIGLRRKSSSLRKLGGKGGEEKKEDVGDNGGGGSESRRGIDPPEPTPEPTPEHTPDSTPSGTPSVSRQSSKDQFYDEFSVAGSSFGGDSFSEQEEGSSGELEGDEEGGDVSSCERRDDREFFNSERIESFRAETARGQGDGLGLKSMLKKAGIGTRPAGK